MSGYLSEPEISNPLYNQFVIGKMSGLSGFI
jgi:hypothetical protein